MANLARTDNSTDGTGFKIERKIGTNGAWGQLTTVPANTSSYSDTSATTTTTFYYRVNAFNRAGYSAFSNEAGQVNAPPTITLTSPASVATFNAPANINLDATASADNATITKLISTRTVILSLPPGTVLITQRSQALAQALTP
jgi:hypothetical protein